MQLITFVSNNILFEKNKKQNEEDKNRYYRQYSSVDRLKYIDCEPPNIVYFSAILLSASSKFQKDSLWNCLFNNNT